MKKINKVLISGGMAILLAGGSMTAFGTAAMAAPGDPVHIQDQALKNSIAEALGLTTFGVPYTGDITEAQMATLTTLSASIPDLSSLVGLEYATGLDVLIISGEGSGTALDLAPLENLLTLDTLILGDHSVSNLNSISALSALTVVDLKLDDSVTSITTLPVANLDTLGLSSTVIGDYSHLAGATALQNLTLEVENLGNTSYLSSLADLEYLILDSDSLTDAGAASIISAIPANNIIGLALTSTEVTTLPSLTGFTALRSLVLEDMYLTDSPLQLPTLLQVLSVTNSGLETLPDLSALNSLTTVALDANSISDISGVASLKDAPLQHLSLAGNSISDFSPIGAPSEWSGLVNLSVQNQNVVLNPGTTGQKFLDNREYKTALGTDITDFTLAGNQVKGYPGTPYLATDGSNLLDFAVATPGTPRVAAFNATEAWNGLPLTYTIAVEKPVTGENVQDGAPVLVANNFATNGQKIRATLNLTRTPAASPVATIHGWTITYVDNATEEATTTQVLGGATTAVLNLDPEKAYTVSVNSISAVAGNQFASPVTTAEFTTPKLNNGGGGDNGGGDNGGGDNEKVAGPANISHHVVNDTTANLNWEAPKAATGANLPTKYEIELTHPSGEKTIIDVDGAKTTQELTGLVKGAKYSAKVRATLATTGVTEWSNSTSFTMAVAEPGLDKQLPTILGLKAVKVENKKGAVNLSWNAPNSGKAETYTVAYRVKGTTDWTIFPNTVATAEAAVSNLTGAHYEFTVRYNTPEKTFSEWAAPVSIDLTNDGIGGTAKPTVAAENGALKNGSTQAPANLIGLAGALLLAGGAAGAIAITRKKVIA